MAKIVVDPIISSSRQGIVLFFGILLILLGSFFPTIAQNDSEVWFRNFGLKEGLPNSTVSHFHQDSQGFIWLSTQQGTVRYDGYDFKSYTLPAENNIPQSNIAGVILEDQQGVVWVGYQTNHYIARYDSVRDQFDYLDMQKELGIDAIEQVRLLGIDNQQNLWASLLSRDNPENPIIIRLDTKDRSIHAYINENKESTIEHAFTEPQYFSQHVSKNAFLAENDNTVWIGANDGLIKIDDNDEAVSYAYGEKGLRSTPIYQLLEVNNTVWAATDSGLVAYDETADHFNLVPGTPDPLQQEPVQNLYRDEGGTIWVTGLHHTYRYRNGNFVNLDPREELTSLEKISMMPQVETDHQIWFVNQLYTPSRLDATDGFTVYDKQEDAFQIYNENLPKLGAEALQRITGIFTDKSGSIWIGTVYSGLFQYPRGYKKFDTHFTSDYFEELLNEEMIYRARVSPSGNIFAASLNGNIFVKDPSTGEESVFYQPEALSSNAVGDRNAIVDLYWESPRQMLVATEWSGLQRINYNPDTFEIQDTTIWTPPQMKAGLPLNLIKDGQDQLWIGTTIGAIKANLDNNEFSRHDAFKVPSGSYDNRNRFGEYVYEDTDGYLWYYFPQRAGIKRVDPRNETVKAYNTAKDVPEELVITEVLDFLETRDGHFLAVAGDETYILNPDSGRFEPYLDMPLPVANSIAQNKQGEIIIGTLGYGYFWIDPETRKIVRRLNTANGLASDVTNDIRIDSTGNHWLLHSLGITKYNPKRNILVNYGSDRGLPASQSETGYRFFEGRDGTIFPIWASDKGLSSFNLYNITTNSYSSSPTFTQIAAGNTTLPLSSKNGVTISPDNSNISLSYSALQFSEPSHNEYRYMLNDGEWTDWQQSHQASFAQLSPGSYIFKVQARNADRVVAPKTASYKFTIVPPWYQSILAYLLYFLFGIGGLAYAAFRYSNYRTEQKAIRMQAKQAEELAKLDRMKTNLLTNISHELRTPLTLVLGPIEQLQEKATKLGEDWKRRLDIARRNGNRLQQLVEQVLDLTHLDAKQLELDPVNLELTTFLSRIAESFRSMAEQNGITIETNLPEDPVAFQADTDKLEKIMVNLLSNAIKFTPPEGAIRLVLTSDEDSVQIKVSDTGRGISEDRLPHIFDRFHSTSEDISGGGRGLGVGLAITKEFVELHDGTISVESEEKSGTTFSITLPFIEYETNLTEYDTGQHFDETAEEETIPKRSIPAVNKEEDPFVIMVVEDNEDMREYIADLLGNEALQVKTAENGLTAQKKLAIIEPDLIICDIMMPEMNGFAFAEHVRSIPEYRLTPIVMLSARAEVDDRVRGYEIGISDYLVKPFNETELKARVENLLHLKTEREKQPDSQNKRPEESSAESKFVKQLQTFVEDHLTESKITAELLAETTNLSRRQLYRKLKAATGCTPAEFVREIKLYKAREILESKQKQTMAEVAYAIGFSTPSYFSKLYKERFGRSPADYG